MKSKFLKTALVSLTLLIGLGCERPASEKSQVALQLPTYKNETALACTKCLKAIVVNVNSENFRTIVFNEKMDNMSEAGTQLASEIILDIPSGLARKIQILAIYLLPDSTTEVQYGSTVADLLVAEPPPITVTLTSLGLFKGGSIVGRYLTIGNSGPTGNVIISVNHAASGMNMDIGVGEMLNGWFDLLASENFPMSYRLASGITIPEWQNITLDGLVPLNSITTGTNRARIRRPPSYFVQRNSTWIQVNENHDIVYGFFGPAMESLTKTVCIEHQSAPLPFVNLSSVSSGTLKLTFDEGSDTSADIYGIGGVDSVFNPECTLNNSVEPLYTRDVISIRKSQFDGAGNDTARAKGGAFSYLLKDGFLQKFNVTGSAPVIYSFKALPGLFSGVIRGEFDGVKLFKKANATNGGFDNLKCFPFWLESAGFTETTLVDPDITLDIVRFSLAQNPLPTDGFILCPTTAGALTGLGGFYVGALAP